MTRQIEASDAINVFFHKTAMAGGVVPVTGTPVEFVDEMTPNGRLRASSVRAL